MPEGEGLFTTFAVFWLLFLPVGALSWSPLKVLVMSQMLLVKSIASDVQIGLIERVDSLRTPAKSVFHKISVLTLVFHTAQVWSLSSFKVSWQVAMKT